MLKQLRVKLFGRSRKEITKDMQVLLDGISDNLTDIHIDISDLQETIQESLKLTLIIQQQCNELIALMEKNKGEDNE